MAQLIHGLDAAQVAAQVAQVREEIATAAARVGRAPADVTLLAAVKYVPTEELGALVGSGLAVLGENRAQALAEKASGPHGSAFEWHFIGQLQSRKVSSVLEHATLVHSVESHSVLTQLERHGSPDTRVLVQVNVAGEAGKAGVAPHELGSFLEACPVGVLGLSTMPPATSDPEGNRRHFAALRELAATHGLGELSMGTSQDFVVAVEEGATFVRVGSRLYAEARAERDA